jgi:RNA polymerase sigma factor (sigma-70 family)
MAETCSAFVRNCDEAIRRVGAIHALPPGDLDDFAQDAWLAVLKALESGGYDPRRGRWNDWLFVVARNRAMTFFRRRWRSERSVVQVPLELLESRLSEDPSWLLDRRCDVEAVRGALDTLQQRTSPITFAVFYLRQMKQLGVAEVAEALSLTRAQVRVYDHRARRKLESILVHQGFV